MSSEKSFLLLALQARTRSKLSQGQMGTLLTVPDAALTGCWMTFIWTLVKTGNLYDAAVALLECLMAAGKVPPTQMVQVQGAQEMIRTLGTQEQFFQCVFNLVIAIFAGTPIPVALYKFLLCLMGTPEPPVDPPSGELPKFNLNPVTRCV